MRAHFISRINSIARVLVGLTLCVFWCTQRSLGSECRGLIAKGSLTFDGSTVAVGPHVVIDGNTGKKLHGQLVFGETDQILVFVNKPNPFRYSYSTNIDVSSYEVESIQSFFRLMGLPVDTIKRWSRGEPSDRRAERRTQCLGKWEEWATQALGTARQAILTLVKSDSICRAFVDSTNRTSGNLGQWYDQACVVLNTLDAPGALDTTNLHNLLVKLDIWVPHVDSLHSFIELMGQSCQLQEGDAAIVKNDLEKWHPLLTDYRLAYNELAATVPEMQELRNLICKVLSDDEAFVEVHPVFLPERSGRVTVTVSRVDMRTPNAKREITRPMELRVGEPVLSLSIGPCLSWVHDVTVESHVGTGVDSAHNVFGTHEQSHRITSFLMLNARILDISPRRVTMAATIGTDFNLQRSKPSPDYFAGFSVGIAKNRFFISMGYIFQQIEEIGGGYKEEDRIPAGMTDLPINYRWKTDFALAISLRPW